MTTQPETPVVERVSRIEGIVEQINLRLAENHDGIQALGAKIDAETKALNEKIDRLRIEMHRQTLILGGVLGGLMALFRFLG